jgi:hypothetical protein
MFMKLMTYNALNYLSKSNINICDDDDDIYILWLIFT